MLHSGEHGLTVTSPAFETMAKSFKVVRGETTFVELELRPIPSKLQTPPIPTVAVAQPDLVRKPEPTKTIPPPPAVTFELPPIEEMRRPADADAPAASAPPESTFLGNNAGELKVLTLGGVEVPLRWCPGGSFKMGSPLSEPGRSADEDQVGVELTRGYWLGETEVTQGLWERVMGMNPSQFKGARRPVENVSWEEANEFCVKLTGEWERSGVLPEGWSVSLPTEAQWEYGCRAGTTTAFSFGESRGELSQYGWFDQNSGNETHEVGLLRENGWGLKDMHGNVWEWCGDWYGERLRGGRDPRGPASGSLRVIRGGCWLLTPASCRSALRNGHVPSIRYNALGFRLVLSPSGL